VKEREKFALPLYHKNQSSRRLRRDDGQRLTHILDLAVKSLYSLEIAQPRDDVLAVYKSFLQGPITNPTREAHEW
jgi:hypothetical protein